MRSPAWLAALCVTFALAGPAAGTVVEELGTEALVARADRIVRGRVLQQQSRWDEARERIYTDIEIAVDESYKGGALKTVVVRRLGGSVDGIGMRAIGEVLFADGEEVFLFLRRIGTDKLYDVHQTIGLSQGKLRIVRPLG